MKVKDLMSSEISFIKADTDLKSIAKVMKSSNIGIVPVCDNLGVLLGLVTDRDLVLRGLASDDLSLEKICASDIMTQEITSVSSEDNIHDAALIFSEEKLRRLPVISDARLTGILSVSDLAKRRIFLAEVSEIMGSLNGCRLK